MLWIIFLTAAMASDLPSDWFHLPENGPIAKSASTAGGEKVTNKVISEQKKFLRKLGPKMDRHWSLRSVRWAMGVTTSGLMGLTPLSSTSIVEIFWSKSKTSIPPKTTRLPSDISDEKLDQQVEQLTKTYLHSLSPKAQKKAKAQLLVRAREMKLATQSMGATEWGAWTVAVIRQDFDFSLSGDILPILSAKGSVRLRLEFTPVKRSEKSVSDPSPLIRSLLGEATEILHTKAYEKIKVDQFELTQIWMGFGIQVSGNLPMLGLSARPRFWVHLARKKETPRPSSFLEEDSIPYFFPQSPKTLTFARDNNLELAPVGNYVRVPRRRFASGMTKALKMGHFFVKKAPKTPIRGWNIYRFYADYELSLGGDLFFVTLKGNSIIRFVMDRRQQ